LLSTGAHQLCYHFIANLGIPKYVTTE
jgi:hypothetical protein